MQHQPDATEHFLNSLPELGPDQSFTFACHPGVRCFNACCGDLSLQLTPYDALRLRRSLGLGSQEFITGYASVLTSPDTGFPSLRLNMEGQQGNPCPFVSSQGCTVYEDRPGACRTYPLGRATRVVDGEIVERFFLVREPHCKGFEHQTAWTPRSWLADQGLQAYNERNDRLMRVMARQKALGGRISTKMANMAFLALYQPENFQKFIRDMKLFKRLDVAAERREAVLADEEQAVDFGLDWVELAAFGDCATLARLP